MSHELSRRKLLQITGVGLAVAGMPVSLSFANTSSNKRLLVVILRGGMDGLAAVVPHADAHYETARGLMALPLTNKALIPLNSDFSMHTALPYLAKKFAEKQLVLMHAAATPYRNRSHFDVQDVLETGTEKQMHESSGWLNRAVASLGGQPETIALGPGIPLVLRGDYRVASWSPPKLKEVGDDFLSRVRSMYETDDRLLEAFDAAQGFDMAGAKVERTKQGSATAFPAVMQKAASFMAPQVGARVATVEMTGWDTHAGQGLATGGLAGKFKLLDNGLKAFEGGMGERWKDTAILVVTEFGRTVKGNGTGGTDHGTGGLAMLLGGAVSGGQMVGDWPGLGKLYEDRDLMPTNDVRLLIKATLEHHLGVDNGFMADSLFPGTKNKNLSENVIL